MSASEIFDTPDDDDDYQDRIIHAMVNYQDDTLNKYSYQQELLSSAKLKHQEKLLQSGLGSYYKSIINCVEANQTVLKEMLQFNLSQFQENDRPQIPNPLQRRTLRLDNFRVNDMLAAIEREWSNEGATKRKQMWDLVLSELSKVIKNKTISMSSSEAKEVIG